MRVTMRVCMCAVLVVVCGVGSCCGVWLETSHTGVWKVPEDTLHNLSLSLHFNDTELFQLLHANPWSLEESSLEVTVFHDEEWKLDWVNKSVQFTIAEVREEVNKSLMFSGYYWGRTSLAFFLTRDDLHPTTNHSLLRDDLEIIIDRKVHRADTVFIIFGSVFILINNINMGAQLDMDVIKGVLKKPLGPLCGFISQFAVMPLITFAMGELFFPDNPLYRLGLFTLGCSPGGIFSNFWTLMFNGDINLSITMTAVSTLAAMGMMPLWLFTLGRRLLHEHENIQVPFSNLAVSLISLTIPVCVGIFLRFKKPVWADVGGKIIKPFTLVVLLIFMVLGTYNSYKVLTMMTWEMVVVGVLVSFTGYTLGACLARLMCLARPQIVAISIETAFQNAGVALVLLKLSLPSPDSDIATLPIMGVMMMTGLPVMFVYGIYALLRRYCGCCPDAEDHQLPHQVTAAEETPQEHKPESDALLSHHPDQCDWKHTSVEKADIQYGVIVNGLTRQKSLEPQYQTKV